MNLAQDNATEAPPQDDAGGEAQEYASFAPSDPLIANPEASIERLPLLRSLFDAMAVDFASGLEALADSAVSFTTESLHAVRIGDLQETCVAQALGGVFHAHTLDSDALIALDRTAVIVLLEILFGSNVVDPLSDDERPMSRIERRVAQFAIERLAQALAAGLAPVVETHFDARAFIEAPEAATIGRRSAVAVICHCALRAFGREGVIFVALPRAAFDPFRIALSRDPSDDAPAPDERWAKRLRDRIVQTEVKVTAMMERHGLTLGDVADFEIGQVITLPISPTSLIKLECEHRTLFWCALGQKDSFYSVRVEEFIDESQEFIQGLIGG